LNYSEDTLDASKAIVEGGWAIAGAQNPYGYSLSGTDENSTRSYFCLWGWN
jgi:hypothetical protein